MKVRLLSILLVFSFSCIGLAHGQVQVHDLSEAIDNSMVVLEDANGTGASSGSSVNGVLVNQTDRELHIDVYLYKPLFLINRGRGQNMIASQVYYKNGGYRSDGKRSFITLQPKKRSRITFIAYCADFDKSNPSEAEEFIVASPPESLREVMRNIIKFSKQNPNTDITVAAQVAIWLAQGESISEIAKKFHFSVRDEQLARRFLSNLTQ